MIDIEHRIHSSRILCLCIWVSNPLFWFEIVLGLFLFFVYTHCWPGCSFCFLFIEFIAEFCGIAFQTKKLHISSPIEVIRN